MNRMRPRRLSVEYSNEQSKNRTRLCAYLAPGASRRVCVCKGVVYCVRACVRVRMDIRRVLQLWRYAVCTRSVSSWGWGQTPCVSSGVVAVYAWKAGFARAPRYTNVANYSTVQCICIYI